MDFLLLFIKIFFLLLLLLKKASKSAKKKKICTQPDTWYARVSICVSINFNYFAIVVCMSVDVRYLLLERRRLYFFFIFIFSLSLSTVAVWNIWWCGQPNIRIHTHFDKCSTIEINTKIDQRIVDASNTIEFMNIYICIFKYFFMCTRAHKCIVHGRKRRRKCKHDS